MKAGVSLGWMGPDKEDVAVTNRTGAAVAVGDVVVLDNYKVDGDSTTNTVGVSTGGLGNILKVVTAKQPYAIYGVVLAIAADNAKTVIRLRGPVDAASVGVGGASTTLGATASVCVAPTNAAVSMQSIAQASTVAASTDTAKPTKQLFIPLTAVGAGPIVTDGWFDGINGFGSILMIPN